MNGQLKVVIIGTGGHAKVVAETIMMDGRYELSGFVNQEPGMTEYLDYPVRPTVSEFGVSHFIVGIGANVVRSRIYDENIEIGHSAVTAVHPGAIVSPSAIIGPGTVIAAGAIVNPFAKVGRNCIINTGAILEHDCIIGDNVHLAPGTKLAGNVSVGNGSFVGIGSTVIPGMKIGDHSMIGAGAVVINDVMPSTTVVGVPAKLLERE